MKLTAATISAGTLPLITVHRGVEPNLDWLHQQVGGYIKIVRIGYTVDGHYDPQVHAYMNENGLAERLEINWLATLIQGRERLTREEFLVGPMVLLGTLNERGESDGDEHSLPEPFVGMLHRLGRMSAFITVEDNGG